MDLIDEVIGYAKSNAEAAHSRDRDTWAAHERNCIRVKAEIERLRDRAEGAEAETRELRAALKGVEIALARDDNTVAAMAIILNHALDHAIDDREDGPEVP